jgi:hypothetical protein
VETKQITDAEVLDAFPYVLIDQDNIEHFRGRLRKKFLINRCQNGHWIYPHLPLCPQCWSTDITPTEVSGKGTLFMFTLLHQGSPIPGVDYATPHPEIAVELPEQKGLRVMTTIVDCPNEDIRIGMPVQLTWIDINGAPTPVFRPAD